MNSKYYDAKNKCCKKCGMWLMGDTPEGLKKVIELHTEGECFAEQMRKMEIAESIKKSKKEVQVDKPVALKDEQNFDLIQRPKEIIEDATEAAKQLTAIVTKKPKKVIINNEQYLEFEDWQTLGRFYGLFVKTGEPELVNVDGVKGFKANAKVVTKTGIEVGSATAYCLRDERNWGDKPTFQLASMSQTRAGAKALRNLLAWVAVLAGYKPTPAEEIIETNGEQIPAKEERPQSIGKLCSDKQVKCIFAIRTKLGMSEEDLTKRIGEEYGVEKINELTMQQASELIESLQPK